MRTLIVDDSKIARNILKDIVSSLDFTLVGEAENGQEGLELYKKLEPELILCDIEMPVMDGIAMTSQICRENNNVQIIMITSVISKKVTHKALLHGASAVLAKPINKEMLLKTIKGED